MAGRLLYQTRHTVTITNGGSMEIGYFAQADEKFNNSFFSRGRRSSTRVGSFTLRASIEETPLPTTTTRSAPTGIRPSGVLEPLAPPQ